MPGASPFDLICMDSAGSARAPELLARERALGVRQLVFKLGVLLPQDSGRCGHDQLWGDDTTCQPACPQDVWWASKSGWPLEVGGLDGSAPARARA